MLCKKKKKGGQVLRMSFKISVQKSQWFVNENCLMTFTYCCNTLYISTRVEAWNHKATQIQDSLQCFQHWATIRSKLMAYKKFHFRGGDGWRTPWKQGKSNKQHYENNSDLKIKHFTIPLVCFPWPYDCFVHFLSLGLLQNGWSSCLFRVVKFCFKIWPHVHPPPFLVN